MEKQGRSLQKGDGGID